jgi:hypothetical protein
MPNPTPAVNPPAIHGKDSILAISLLSTPVTLVAVALITDWTLDMATDTVETTALGDPNKTYVQGLKDIKGTFTGQWDSTDDTLFEAAESAVPIVIAIFPNKNNAAAWQGPGYLNVSLKGGASAAVTIDGAFTAAGAWARTPAGAAPALAA